MIHKIKISNLSKLYNFLTNKYSQGCHLTLFWHKVSPPLLLKSGRERKLNKLLLPKKCTNAKEKQNVYIQCKCVVGTILWSVINLDSSYVRFIN